MMIESHRGHVCCRVCIKGSDGEWGEVIERWFFVGVVAISCRVVDGGDGVY